MKKRRKASQSGPLMGLGEPLEQREPEFRPTGSAAMVAETGDNFTEGCRHCGATRHHLRKGRRCKYCDRLVQGRRRALRWQLDNPQSLKGCMLVCNGTYPTLQELERFRANYLRAIDEQLKRRRFMEARLHERVSGLDLEHMLWAVADFAGAEDGSSLFHGIAGYLESVFDAKASSELYKLLYDIIEAQPARMNYRQLLDGVFSTAVVSAPPGSEGDAEP